MHPDQTLHRRREIDREFPDVDRSMHEALEAMTCAAALMGRTERKGQTAERVRQAFDICHEASIERADHFGFVEFSDLGLGYRLIEPRDVARIAETLAGSAPDDIYAERLRRLWALAARCHAAPTNWRTASCHGVPFTHQARSMVAGSSCGSSSFRYAVWKGGIAPLERILFSLDHSRRS